MILKTSDTNGLGASQIEDFISTGYLKLKDAFDPYLAGKGRDELWSAMGLSPDDPSGWTSPVVRLGFQRSQTFVTAANTPSCMRPMTPLSAKVAGLRLRGWARFPFVFHPFGMRATPAGLST